MCFWWNLDCYVITEDIFDWKWFVRLTKQYIFKLFACFSFKINWDKDLVSPSDPPADTPLDTLSEIIFKGGSQFIHHY